VEADIFLLQTWYRRKRRKVEQENRKDGVLPKKYVVSTIENAAGHGGVMSRESLEPFDCAQGKLRRRGRTWLRRSDPCLRPGGNLPAKGRGPNICGPGKLGCRLRPPGPLLQEEEGMSRFLVVPCKHNKTPSAYTKIRYVQGA